MKKDELIERAEAYKRLIEYPEWEMFVKELLHDTQGIENAILTDKHEPRIFEKGERAGILKAVTLPQDAIDEVTNLEEK